MMSPELEPTHRQGSFLIEYEGNFSNQLKWDLQQLSRLAQVSDLRSDIRITRGNERYTPEYMEAGDVAIWKNRCSLTSERESVNPGYTLKEQMEHDQIIIELNDQVLIQQAREKYDLASVFTTRLQDELSRGIRDALWREKSYQALMSSGMVGISAGFMVPLLMASYAGLRYGIPGMYDFFTDNHHDISAYLRGGLNYLGVLIGTQATILSPKFAIFVKREFDKTIKTQQPYFQSYSDFNPAKHLSNLIYGSAYTVLHEKDFVTLQSQE